MKLHEKEDLDLQVLVNNMITIQDAKEILYQVKHSTGIHFNEPENTLAHFLVILAEMYQLNKEELIDHYILAVYDLSRKQHFNWN